MHRAQHGHSVCFESDMPATGDGDPQRILYNIITSLVEHGCLHLSLTQLGICCHPKNFLHQFSNRISIFLEKTTTENRTTSENKSTFPTECYSARRVHNTHSR